MDVRRKIVHSPFWGSNLQQNSICINRHSGRFQRGEAIHLAEYFRVVGVEPYFFPAFSRGGIEQRNAFQLFCAAGERYLPFVVSQGFSALGEQQVAFSILLKHRNDRRRRNAIADYVVSVPVEEIASLSCLDSFLKLCSIFLYQDSYNNQFKYSLLGKLLKGLHRYSQ